MRIFVYIFTIASLPSHVCELHSRHNRFYLYLNKGENREMLNSKDKEQ